MITRLHLLRTFCAVVVLAPVFAAAPGGADDLARTVIQQKNRNFQPVEISIAKGSTVRFENSDPFLHQIFVSSPSFSFDSDEQSPGENIDVPFTATGDFTVKCGIHPKMSLTVHVQ